MTNELYGAGETHVPLLAQRLQLPQTTDGGTICRCMDDVTFFLVRFGTAELQACGESVELTAGDAVFVNAGCPHVVWAPNGCEGAFFTIPAQLVCGGEESPLWALYAQPLLADAGFVYHSLPRARHAQLLTLLDNILELETSRPDGFELLVKGLACTAWEQLWAVRAQLRRSEAKPARPPRDMERMRRVLSYIHGHYAEKLSLDTIAQACEISRSECCRMFQRVLRQSPFDYLLRYRVYRSLPLVMEGGLSITEIAWITGFSGASYFSEIFRRYHGCSPTEYRKNGAFAPQKA